jgi:hypothetical protein
MKSQRLPTLRGAGFVLQYAAALFATALVGISQAAIQEDPTFHYPDDPALDAYWCHVLPGGKLLVGGTNTFRLNADGSRDQSFPVFEFRYAAKPVLEPGGGFTTFGESYNENTGRWLSFGTRVDANGAIDTSFQPQLENFSDIRVFRRDSRGGYVIGGRGLLPPSSPERHSTSSCVYKPMGRRMSAFIHC